jgi:hypothetical protein
MLSNGIIYDVNNHAAAHMVARKTIFDAYKKAKIMLELRGSHCSHLRRTSKRCKDASDPGYTGANFESKLDYRARTHYFDLFDILLNILVTLAVT